MNKKNAGFWIIWVTGWIFLYLVSGSWSAGGILFGSLIMMTGSWIVCMLSGKKLHISFVFPQEAKKESTFEADISVQNHSILPVVGVQAEICWENTLTGEEGRIWLPFGIRGKGSKVLPFSGTCRSCGFYRIWMERCICGDILSLFQKKRTVRAGAGITVFPEEILLNPEQFSGEMYQMESFRYSQERSGNDPGETFDLRAYRDGDSIRQIHWKLSEKLGETVIRERSYPVYHSILLLPELGPATDGTAPETGHRQPEAGKILRKRPGNLKEKSMQKKEAAQKQEEQEADVLAQVCASTALTFLRNGIPFDIGFFEAQQQKFRIERIETEEAFWELFAILLQSAVQDYNAVQRYEEECHDRSFAHYVYLTNHNRDRETERLGKYGRVMRFGCGDVFFQTEDQIVFTVQNWKKELGAKD